MSGLKFAVLWGCLVLAPLNARAGTAALSFDLSAYPSSVCLSQLVTVIGTVNNGGSGTAVSVSTPAALIQIGTGGFLLRSAPPVQGLTLPQGASAQFTYTYSAIGTGSVRFSGLAVGTDLDSDGPISSAAANSGTLNITVPAILGVSGVSQFPASVPACGGAFTVIVSVANNGGAALSSVSVVARVRGGTSGGTLLSAVAPSLVPVIASGASAQFTFTGQPTAGSGGGPWTQDYTVFVQGINSCDGSIQSDSASSSSINVTGTECSPTPSPTLTPSATATATATASPLPPAPSITATFTLLPTQPPAPTVTRTIELSTIQIAPGQGNVAVLNSARGNQLCLAFQHPVVVAACLVYNFVGELVATDSDVLRNPCLSTDNLAPGVYFVRIEAVLGDGRPVSALKKAVVLPP